MAQMARATSSRVLSSTRSQAGDSYAARLIYAYRLFQLHPGRKDNAERILSLIPATEADQTAVMTLGDSLCDRESVSDMTTLSRVYDGLPRELAKAVLVDTSFLPKYLQYSMVAILDPHSNFAVQTKRVCQKAHAGFIRAVNLLPEGKQEALAKHILNPSNCTVIARPEADK
jgi:hypothetical protein